MMAIFEAVYNFGIGYPVVNFEGNVNDVVKKAKEWGKYNGVKNLALYYGQSKKSVGHWKLKNGRWYRE